MKRCYTFLAYSGNGEISPNSSLQQKGGFERSFGSQILNPQSAERYNLMGMLEDHARVLLMEDEYKAVLRHIHNVSNFILVYGLFSYLYFLSVCNKIYTVFLCKQCIPNSFIYYHLSSFI